MSDPVDTYLNTVIQSQVPQSLEAEEAVIGSVLVNPSVYVRIAMFLKPTDFYYLKLSYIWQAFGNLLKRNEPIDYLTVIQELKTTGWLNEVGGPAEITRLATQTPTAVHAEVYGKLVERASVRRSLLNMTDLIRGYALDTRIDLNEVINQSQSQFLQVLGRVVESRGQFIGQGMKELLDEMEHTAAHPQQIVGIPTGYIQLDELLGGIEKQDLIIVAGRPGAGKSAFCGCVALNIAKAGYKVGVFPNEMRTKEFNRRILAVESGINSRRARRAGGLSQREWATILSASARIHELPIYIDDFRSTPTEIKAKAKALKSGNGLDVLLIDGLYRMPADSGAAKPYERFSEVAEAIKNLSRDLDIPVVATHQLNRENEKRQDKHPILSDLSGSGRIEQEADQVWFIHRPVMYDEATEFPNQAKLIVAKNRDGATGAISLFFERSLTKFMDASVRQVSLREKIQGKSIPEYEED